MSKEHNSATECGISGSLDKLLRQKRMGDNFALVFGRTLNYLPRLSLNTRNNSSVLQFYLDRRLC